MSVTSMTLSAFDNSYILHYADGTSQKLNLAQFNEVKATNADVSRLFETGWRVFPMDFPKTGYIEVT